LPILKINQKEAKTGINDSKKIHTPGDIGPIEAKALAGIHWLTGRHRVRITNITKENIQRPRANYLNYWERSLKKETLPGWKELKSFIFLSEPPKLLFGNSQVRLASKVV
jgi:hypothetical protein